MTKADKPDKQTRQRAPAEYAVERKFPSKSMPEEGEMITNLWQPVQNGFANTAKAEQWCRANAVEQKLTDCEVRIVRVCRTLRLKSVQTTKVVIE